jgi:hypothetical protein
MGSAAYNRASAVICVRIRETYRLEALHRHQLIERAETLIEQFDQFSRKAQDLFWDCVNEESARGMLKSLIHANIRRKRDQKTFKALQAEAATAHCLWVDCDRRDSLAYLDASRRKAIAWHAILSTLNRSFHLPFTTPNFGV